MKFHKFMRLPLTMEVVDDEESIDYGCVDLIDCNDFIIGTIITESPQFRDNQNIIDTKKDAIYIVNATNNFEEMVSLINNYRNNLINFDRYNSDIGRIDDLFKSFIFFKNEFDNGVPHNWEELG